MANQSKTAQSPSVYVKGWSPHLLCIIRVCWCVWKHRFLIFLASASILPLPWVDPTQIHFPPPVTKHAAHRKLVIFSCSNPEQAVGGQNFLANGFNKRSVPCSKVFVRCQAGAISCWAMARCRRLEASAQHPSAQHPSAQHRRPSSQWFWLPWRPRQIFEGLPRTV